MNIPVEELKARVKRLQTRMRIGSIDQFIVFSWKRGQVKYLSGYHPNYIANTAVVLVPPSGDPKLFIRFPFDLERAQRESWIQTIKACGDMKKMAEEIAREIKRNDGSIHHIGFAGGDFVMDEMPYSFLTYLQHSFPDKVFSDQRKLLMDLRLIKSSEEVEAIRKSAHIADQGLHTAKRIIEAGKTELQVVAGIEETLRESGAEDHLVVIASPGSRKLIGPPTGRTILPGEEVIIEVAVENEGYWSQAAAVLFPSAPTPMQNSIRNLTYGAYQDAVIAMKCGIRCSEIAQRTIHWFRENGFEDFIEQDFGHGIGLDLPEPPKLEIQDNTLLSTGMIVVAHPALRVPSVGGAFIGGTVVIREQQAEELHDLSFLMEEIQ